MNRSIKAVAVYCGAATGARADYAAAARTLGVEIARRGAALVYGGGNVGLMGVVADAALAAGGRVIGVIPRLLVDKELAHNGLHELRVVADMHERKAAMIEAADAFVALPGGVGTLEELTEVWSWGQLAIHRKPVGLLNVAGYYDLFLAFLDHAVQEGLLPVATRALLAAAHTAEQLLTILETTPVTPDRWS